MNRNILVIGAGQAGLAAGYHLRGEGLPFIIVEESNRIGDEMSRIIAEQRELDLSRLGLEV